MMHDSPRTLMTMLNDRDACAASSYSYTANVVAEK
jgi:hypothetical protein